MLEPLRWKLVQWLATWDLIVDICPDLIPESDSRNGFMHNYVFPAELASEVGERLVELIVRGTVRRYLGGSKVSFRTSRTDPTVKMKRKVACAFTRSALTEHDVRVFAALCRVLASLRTSDEPHKAETASVPAETKKSEREESQGC